MSLKIGNFFWQKKEKKEKKNSNASSLSLSINSFDQSEFLKVVFYLIEESHNDEAIKLITTKKVPISW
jgi:hypothetical protein